MDITASLLGTGNVLLSLPAPGGLDRPAPEWGPADLVDVATDFGPARAVPSAGIVAGHPASYDVPAGRLGRHAPTWRG
jgi:hypothetical protein